MKRVEKTLDIAREAQKKDCDSVFVVVGRERVGKSNLTLHCDEYLGAQLGNIVVDKKYMGEGLASVPIEGTFHFDEAVDGLYTKDGMKTFNKEMEKLFMICGAKKWITFVLIPDFFLLSPYFRKHRVVGLFWVYARGKVAFYDRAGIKKINFNHEKYRTSEIKGGRPLYYDTFPKYKGHLLEGYLQKKDAKMTGMIASFQEVTAKPPKSDKSKKERIIEMHKNGWKAKDISKEIKASHQYVREVIAMCD